MATTPVCVKIAIGLIPLGLPCEPLTVLNSVCVQLYATVPEPQIGLLCAPNWLLPPDPKGIAVLPVLATHGSGRPPAVLRATMLLLAVVALQLLLRLAAIVFALLLVLVLPLRLAAIALALLLLLLVLPGAAMRLAAIVQLLLLLESLRTMLAAAVRALMCAIVVPQMVACAAQMMRLQCAALWPLRTLSLRLLQLLCTTWRLAIALLLLQLWLLLRWLRFFRPVGKQAGAPCCIWVDQGAALRCLVTPLAAL